MAFKNSVGNAQRQLLNRRQRPAAQSESAASSTGPEGSQTRASTSHSLPTVQANQANLQLPPGASNDADQDLSVSSGFLGSTASEAFDDQAVNEPSIERATPGKKDIPSKVDDLQFQILNADLGPGIRPVPQLVLRDDAHEQHTMGISVRQALPVPARPFEPDAVPMPLEDFLYPQPAPTAPSHPGVATHTAPGHPGAPNLPPSTTQQPATPNTSNDHKLALRQQIDESVADLEFFKGIEKRLKALVDTYEDPKGEMKGLYEGTQKLIHSLSVESGKFKAEYAQKYGIPADPMQSQVQDLSKLGQGRRPQSGGRTGAGAAPKHTGPGVNRKPAQAEYARLRQAYQDGLTDDSEDPEDLLNADSSADTSREESEPDLSGLSASSQNIRRKTLEREAELRQRKRNDDSFSRAHASRETFDAASDRSKRGFKVLRVPPDASRSDDGNQLGNWMTQLTRSNET